MTKKTKLQRLLKVLTPDNTLPDFSAFDAQINQLKTNLKDKVTVKTLEQVGMELEKFKSKLNLQPLLDSVTELKTSIKDKTQGLYNELDNKTTELSKADEIRAKNLKLDISALQVQIAFLDNEQKNLKIPDLTDLESRVSELTTELSLLQGTLEQDEKQEVKDWQEIIDKLRKELMVRIGNIGGGSMNRHINFGGVDYLTRYTDINYKAA